MLASTASRTGPLRQAYSWKMVTQKSPPCSPDSALLETTVVHMAHGRLGARVRLLASGNARARGAQVALDGPVAGSQMESNRRQYLMSSSACR